jgi:hemoglobin
MQQTTKYKGMISAFLAVLALAGTARTQDKKPADKPLDRAHVEESIYQGLRGIIDQGADLYNQGDWNGCYRLWEGALMMLKPLVGDRPLRSWVRTTHSENAVYMDAMKALQSRLGDRPGLKEVIDTALATAQQTPQIYRRAFILRVVLDQVRAEIRPAKTGVTKEPKPSSPPQAKKTLWERLGSEPGVAKIVDDFVNLAAPDPKVDFFRGGKFQMTAEQVANMKRELVEQISEASGGLLKYRGPDMKKVHKGMGITDDQFNALAADLKKALEKNNVAPEDVKKVLDAVGGFRKDIVEPKKPEEKKREEKKPEEKSEESRADAQVVGKVMYQGKPAAGARISLVAADGKAVRATVAADGSYRLTVKPGEYTVTISGPAKLGLPAKYAEANTSGLKWNVREGKGTYDLDLH